MANVKALLELQGTPPTEICLDWAWQIESAYAERLDHPLAWSNLDVNSTGELQLNVQEDDVQEDQDGIQANNQAESSSRAVDLIRQLILLGGYHAPAPNDGESAAEDVSYVRHCLGRATREFADGGQHQVVAAQKAASASTIDSDTHQNSNVSDLNSSKITRRDSAPASRVELPKNLQGRKWNLMASAAACGCILILCLFFLRNRGNAVDETREVGGEGSVLASGVDLRSDNHADKDSTSRTPRLEEETAQDFRDEFPLQLADAGDDAAAAELTHFEVSRVDLPTVDNVEAMASLVEATGDAAILGEPTGPQTDEPNAGNESEVQKLGEAASLVEKSEILPAEQVDVVHEIRKVTQLAEDRPEASEVLQELSDAAVQPPLMINTSPLMQIKKTPAAVAGRLRKPEWHLRVAAGEGFTVTPSAAQLVSGRELAWWFITDEEAKEPATRIVVTAGLANNRTPTLRWRIFASAGDIPQVMLPLASEFLDTVQASLGSASQVLNVGIEQLRTANRMKGVPSDLRSAIAERRRELEAQLKISKRVLEVVADASQMNGWMDGQIEVHAQLVDLGNPDSTPLLQFGSLEQADERDGELQTSAVQ